MKDVFLFVYGTLRRDSESDMFYLLAKYANFVGEATYQGKLYKINYYPGAVPSKITSDEVTGEIFRLCDPNLVLSRLDQYEECGTGFKEPTEYIRVLQDVRLLNGEIYSAWIYLYNRTLCNIHLIPSGDFLKLEHH